MSLTLEYFLNDENAEPLFRKHSTDSGWDLTLIRKEDDSGKLATFDTGIILRPPAGYYVEMYPRSSLSKYGYMLSNSVGIIDESYRGNVKVKLYKFDESKPDLELSGRYVQIIMKKREQYDVRQLPLSELDETKRGAGGFGSTGV